MSNSSHLPETRLVRIGLNVFSLSLTDAPAATAAAPELIITSGMRMQPLHEFSWQQIHLTCSPNSLFCCQDRVSLQAFVAQVDGLVVGILIIQDEQVGILSLYGSIGSP